jgi:hypothetical protein
MLFSRTCCQYHFTATPQLPSFLCVVLSVQADVAREHLNKAVFFQIGQWALDGSLIF